ncbi:hypothetical protein OHW42_10205, partial [Acinetobacter baumannii]|nr:hypothetical protein [Acinetobacter baumannii]
MAILTPEKFENLNRDFEDTGKAINTKAVITPRYGEPFYSLPLAIQKVMETGGFEPFLTEAQLLASVPTISPKAAKALDTGKIWYWGKDEGETVDSWHDTGLSELDQAKQYVDSKVKTNLLESSNSENLFEWKDNAGNVVLALNKKGQLVSYDEDTKRSILLTNQEDIKEL